MSEWSWQVAVETSLKTLGERKRNLESDAETLRTTVKASFDQLRRTLDEQEARLLSGVEEVVANSRRMIDEQDANVTSLRSRLSEGADCMNRSVATGDINGVVLHGKRLEESSAQLRESEAIVQAMDTALGGTLPIESAENAIKNLTLSGGHAPGLGSSTYIPHSPPVVSSYGGSSFGGDSSLVTPQTMRAPPVTPATGETVPNAIYVNGVPHDASEADVRAAFDRFGEIKMVNARHISTGGFAFVFFKEDIGAQVALENPRVVINGKTANVLAKKQILSGGVGGR
jgi:RNA recognition motif-containing protein